MKIFLLKGEKMVKIVFNVIAITLFTACLFYKGNRKWWPLITFFIVQSIYASILSTSDTITMVKMTMSAIYGVIIFLLISLALERKK